MSVSWTEDPIPVLGAWSAAEAATAAHHAQYAALAGREPGDWASPWGVGRAAGEAYLHATARGDAFGQYCALRVEQEHPVSCDGCQEVWDLEECVVTRGAEVFCPKCRDAQTEGGWVPEEFFEGGGEL